MKMSGTTSKPSPSQVLSRSTSAPAATRAGRSPMDPLSADFDALPFPLKLHVLLRDAERMAFQSIISWTRNGRSFHIFNATAFTDRILQEYFKNQTKFKSFQRQLNIYGFRKESMGENRGAYFHPFFLRDQMDLCSRITRQKAGMANTRNSGDANIQPHEVSVHSSSSSLTDEPLPPTSNSTMAVPLYQGRCAVEDYEETSRVVSTGEDYRGSTNSSSCGPGFQQMEDLRLYSHMRNLSNIDDLLDDEELYRILDCDANSGGVEPKTTREDSLVGRRKPASTSGNNNDGMTGYWCSDSLTSASDHAASCSWSQLEPYLVNHKEDEDQPHKHSSSSSWTIPPYPKPQHKSTPPKRYYPESENKNPCQQHRRLEEIEQSFPWKLYRMLEDAETEGFEHIISWIQNGKSFKVHDPQAFVKEVSNRYYDIAKYESFRRQLGLYSFDRVARGPDRGTYSHPSFQRGQIDLCHQIVRQGCP